MSKDPKRRSKKLDYLCVTNLWKSLVISSEVKWGPTIHRFGQQYDHGLVIATWRWKTQKREKKDKVRLHSDDRSIMVRI